MMAPIVPILLMAVSASQDTVRPPIETLRPVPRPVRATGARAPQGLGVVQVRADAGTPTRIRALTTSAATRTATPLRDVPQSITALPATLLRDLTLTTVARAMEYVPGVVMGQGEGHRDAPTIRGQSTTADFFVDGVRDDAQYLRDNYNVAQLDVLRGANAAVFGRGGGGGVIHRQLKQPQFRPVRSARLDAGPWAQRRVTLDLGQPLTPRLATRLNLLHEAGTGWRRDVTMERNGINPTLALLAGPVLLNAGAELFTDRRTIDRGLPSVRGTPAPLDPRAFVGDPAQNPSSLSARSAWLQTTWAAHPALTVRTHTRAFQYDKVYQNSYASSALDATGTQFALSAYRSVADRRSLFHQTDLVWSDTVGTVAHTLLAGLELSRQSTDNRRTTGWFGETAATLTVRAAQPTVQVPITWRASATDANNRAGAQVAALFLQEQVRLSRHVQLLGGVRADRVTSTLTDWRTTTTWRRTDRMLAPRAAVLITPQSSLTVYGSWSTAFLPSSGDQFAGLSASTQTLAPEGFRNRELGLTWSALPTLDVRAAWYQLDRSNAAAPDPTDITRLVQTGRQRTAGGELSVQGAVTPQWDMLGSVAVQHARVVQRTTAASAGASVPLVPRTTASLWQRVQVTPRAAVALGVVHQGDRYAALDNTVRLPRFTRVDASWYATLPRGWSTQLHIENLLNVRYSATSHGNNNILPGAGRAVRVGIQY